MDNVVSKKKKKDNLRLSSLILKFLSSWYISFFFFFLKNQISVPIFSLNQSNINRMSVDCLFKLPVMEKLIYQPCFCAIYLFLSLYFKFSQLTLVFLKFIWLTFMFFEYVNLITSINNFYKIFVLNVHANCAGLNTFFEHILPYKLS